MSSPSEAGWPGRIAVGVVRSDPPQIFLSESADVLSRLLAVQLVARTDASELQHVGLLHHIREALLEERWGDAVMLWIDATGEAVDAYPDEPVWTEERLDLEKAALEIRMAPIFEDPS